ncbi:MAG: peptidase M23 [Methylophaga sp.]|nr:MAG: peptidase M23 [Methylophaga sp.]
MNIRYYLTVLLLIYSHIITAENKSAKQLGNVQSEIQTLSEGLSKNKISKDTLYQQLKQQSRTISKINRELLTLKKKIAQKEAELTSVEKHQQQEQQSQTEQLQAINYQIRAAYINAQPSYLKVLLSQQNPATLSRSVAYYRYFHQARQQQLTAINHTLSNLTSQQKELFAIKKSQQKLFQQQQQQHLALQAQSKLRQNTLKQLEQDISSQDARLKRLREQEKSLITLLQSFNPSVSQANNSQQTPFANLNGTLDWPIKGNLLARYGSPRNIGKLTWKGIMIAAPVGKDITATASGKIVFADWLRGFGLLMIIDHGDQYMTLYGNNDTLLKQAGDLVAAGELIAQSGDQGIRQQAGLYFEIRHKGSPTNPIKWLKKQS